MIVKSKLPFQIYQKRSSTKESFDLLLNKIEVITSSNLIISSVRILIVLVALLMGYVHAPGKKEGQTQLKQNEIIEKNLPHPGINKILFYK